MAFADDRAALVTGAASGIGAATIRRLSAEGLEVYEVLPTQQVIGGLNFAQRNRETAT
jgi:NADP-dependent 3-hydroxy acid dehydrogenase YdfG